MFESIVSKISTVVRDTIRAVGTATRRMPWLAPIAIITFFLIW